MRDDIVSETQSKASDTAQTQARQRKIAAALTEELGVRLPQVTSAIDLLDGGATVPFIARYRKEVTGGLDDTHLRNLEARLGYLRELEDRRETILDSIRGQEKMTPELEADLLAADTKTRLEDLYLPYKPKRRTKAQIAREAGLEPLALGLWENPAQDPTQAASAFLNQEAKFGDEKAVLDGARYILMERFAEEADLLSQLRDYVWNRGLLQSKVVEGKEQEGSKYSDYFDYDEPLKKIPSHRALAVFRGASEDVLRLEVAADRAQLEDDSTCVCEERIARYFNIRDQGRPADAWLQKVVQWTWRVKVHPHLKLEFMGRIREAAEEEAIKVFSKNLKDLLMAAPAGRRTTLGLDPGLRTGVKVIVVEDTGKVAAEDTIYPHAPRNRWDDSIKTLAALCKRHEVSLVAIGNGTASRETDRLVADLTSRHSDLSLEKVVVSEAGASVYSASETAALEFPDMDVSLRGAVSIARRLQDPLAELVKIDPKSIGVGQYQHDVNQSKLALSLDTVVEDCVNAVGVDVNTASAPLLAHVSGLNKRLAQNIVDYRDENGRFNLRKQLLKVPRMGAKTFEQAAGFLRILGGDNPLDASAVHPEAYPVVERMAKGVTKPVATLIRNREVLTAINPADYTDDRFGLPTVTDILGELEKPGRDPRPSFKTAKFQEGVESISDLSPGMVLEGVVSNVTNFGAFVDLGVHQDGLVHISALANRYVSDPREVVKAGDIVKVKVMEVDTARKRIGLSMRLDDEPGMNDRRAPRAEQAPRRDDRRGGGKGSQRNDRNRSRGGRQERGRQDSSSKSAFGSALAGALKKKH